MEEEASSSMLSNGNSFDSHYHPYRSSKRSRLDHDHHIFNNNAAKFKGAVPQQNGHWGAQIYANHLRIWLGTFKSEKEAAMAYDSAAIKLRSGDSHRNFPWTDTNIQEPNFQTQFTTEAILNMIRDGSYQPKFANFLRTQSRRLEAGSSFNNNINTSSTINSNNQTRVHGDNGQFSCMQLFQKELTPSDVGKLNRLVIPKKFAVKYFPYISGNNGEDDHGVGSGNGVDEAELVFYDRVMKCWKFRYCYWRSSQSFVFTRGWNRFVKEKNLKEKDVITFYTCVCATDRIQEGRQHFSLIDVSYSNGKSSCAVDGIDQIEEMHKELEFNLRQTIGNKLQNEGCDEKELKEGNSFKGLESKDSAKDKGLRLFGVRID